MPFNYDKHDARFGYHDTANNIFKNCHCFGLATTAVFATTAGTVAANLALVGTLVSVVGVISQGQSAAGNARFQGQLAAQDAELARRNQVRSEQQAKIDEDDFRRQSAAALGERFSKGGATGTLLDQGSFSSIQGQIAGEDELNALRLQNQFAVRTAGFASDAQRSTAQGQLFGAQAKQAGTASLFDAGSAIFSGDSSISKVGFAKSAPKSPAPAGRTAFIT